MRDKIGKILMICGVAMLLMAGSMIAYNHMEDLKAGENAKEKVLELENSIENNRNVDDDKDKKIPTNDMPVKIIDGYEYTGILTIPSIGRKLPILNQCDSDLLKIAPCRYFGSIRTNDLVIAGHNYKRHLGAIPLLKENDSVLFTDTDGMTVKYKVKEITTVMGTDVETMISGGFDLTLFTCTYSGRSRFAVRCERE